MKKIVLWLLFGMVFISFVSAISCTPNSLNKNINVGETPSTETLTCTNNNDFDVDIFKSGDFFSLNPSTIKIINGSSQTFSVQFSQLNEEGSYKGFIYSSDGSIINVNVNVTAIENPMGIIVFPTAKIVNIQQGQIKNQNVQVIVPSNYPRQITLQSVSFNPDIDVVKWGDLNLGMLNPGQTLNLPLIIDAQNVQIGTYSTQISILATDSGGQVDMPEVNLQVVVSVGVNPSTNQTFSTRPDCSLSSIELNRNNSYTFTCTNTVENLEVNPQYNEFFEGIRADYSGSSYTYTFKANKLGSTTFLATFTYKGSPIYEAFSKEIRITPSGQSVVPGTEMLAEFYQSGKKKSTNELTSGEVSIMVLDDETNNLIDIEKVKIYLNGFQQNRTFNLNPDENNELRISAIELGYSDLVLNFTTSKVSLSMSVEPNKEEYFLGEMITVNSTPEGASVLLNDVVINSPYTLNSEGEFLLEIRKEGFESVNKTIKVKRMVFFTPSISFDKWKKGNKIIGSLSETANWTIEFYPYTDVKEKILSETPEIIAEGFSNAAEFKIDEIGRYLVRVNGDMKINTVIEKKGLFGWLPDWSWLTWGIIVVVVVVVVWLVFFRKRKGEKEEGLMFAPKETE